jgi:hypothetical protein
MPKEVWETPYGNAALKIERANKHIFDFQERLLASSDRYGPSLHLDGNTGEKFLYYSMEDRYLRSDLALIAGDAIHNLRSALDIAWVEIVGSRATKFTKFPIDSSKPRNWLESILINNAGIDSASGIFDLVLNHVKGYKGGDRDILALNDLDIDDKHHLLIPMLAITGIQGIELENEDGSIDRLDIATTRFEPYRRTVGINTQLKNHGRVAFFVTFGEGTLVKNLPIIPTLERFSGKVWEIVQHLKRLSR